MAHLRYLRFAKAASSSSVPLFSPLASSLFWSTYSLQRASSSIVLFNYTYILYNFWMAQGDHMTLNDEDPGEKDALYRELDPLKEEQPTRGTECR